MVSITKINDATVNEHLYIGKNVKKNNKNQSLSHWAFLTVVSTLYFH